MKEKFFILVSSLILLSACSEEGYTIEKAVKDGDVVVINKSNDFLQNLQEGTATKNLDEMIKFIDNVKKGEKSKINVVIADKKGTFFKNSLSFDGSKVKYINNYNGYKLEKGEYECTSLDIKDPLVMLSGCNNKQGAETLVFPTTYYELKKTRIEMK